MTPQGPSPIKGWKNPANGGLHWHLDPEAARAVERWFAGWVPEGARKDGHRSVLLPLDSGRQIKIKGAGLRGREVDFDGRRNTGPKMLHFDFEGRVVEDVASGHDAALPGGASFQQAATEWQVSARLAAAGERVLPCLGYGRITRGARVSWFSVFEWSADYSPDKNWPDIEAEVFVARVRDLGALALRLALTHGLIGYPALMEDGRGGQLIKDLHPFRQADPVNMSRHSFAMYLFHALHIIASNTRIRGRKGPPGALPADNHLQVFRSALPEITLADHQDAIDRILLPYMLQLRPSWRQILKSRPKFNTLALVQTLQSNRLTNRLLELVPPGYASFAAPVPGQSTPSSSAL